MSKTIVAAIVEGITTVNIGIRISSRTSASGRPTAASQARSLCSSSRSPAIQSRIGSRRGRIRVSP